MPKATPLAVGKNGKLHSKRSKTGDPKCSAAMSAWVTGRKTGDVASSVFKTLADCRRKAGQNRKAKQLQDSGKIAEGRGTWQRSEAAAKLRDQRAASRPKPSADVVAYHRAILDKVARNAKPKPAAPNGPHASSSADSAAEEARKSALTKFLMGSVTKPAAPDHAAAKLPPERIELANRFATLARANGVEAHTSVAAAVKPGATADEAARINHSAAMRSPAHYDPDRKAIFFKPEHSFYGNAKKEMFEAHHRKGFLSSNSIDHTAHHEIAHALHHRAIGDAKLDKLQAHKMTAEERATGRQVSDYAARSPLEFVAEVYAGRAAGKSYSPEVDTMYRRFEGPDHAGAPAPSPLAAKAREVHAANPGPAMTTHNPHATNATRSDGGFSLAGSSATGRKRTEYHDTGGRGFGQRAPLFGLDDLPANSARGQASLFGGRMDDRNAGVSGTTGRRVEVGVDGQHRLPGDFGKTKTAHLKSAPKALEQAATGSPVSREDRLAGLVGKLRARVSKGSGDRRDPATHTDHASGHVGMLNADLIHADPHRFQYKQGFGEGGSVGSLAGVRKYDPELGGVLQVWKDHGDGKTYVVNGHNRLDLARKLGAHQVTARFIDAKDHHEARAKGALTNIAEGRGTALDAAKFFRDTGTTRDALEARGVPLREKVATDGIALSKLDDHVFKRVSSGEMSEARGAIIGGSGLEHHEQRALVSLLDKRSKGEVSDATLRELTDTVKSSRTVRQESRDLFGSSAEDESLALHKARLQATIKDRLGKEKKLFGIVAKSKHAEDLARAGNSINTEASGQVSRDAAATLGAFDSLKNLSGPVSKRLNDAAERIHANPKDAKRITDETYRGIVKDLPAFLSGTGQFSG